MTTATTEPPGAAAALLPRLLAYRRFWAILALVLLLDQASKLWIVYGSGYTEGLFPPLSGDVWIPGVLNLVFVTNAGAAWGLLQGQGLLLLGVAVVALVAIYAFRNSLELKRPYLQCLFGLICGGIAGNSVDRIVHGGHVIDFIDVDLQFYRWPTFNLADSAIVTGALLYLVYSWTHPQQRHRAAASPAAAAEGAQSTPAVSTTQPS